MNLSASIIVQKLEEHYPVKHKKELSTDNCLGRPIFYTGKEQIISDHLYVMTNINLQTEKISFPKTALLIFVVDDTRKLPTGMANVCTIDSGVDAPTVFNDLQNIFNFFDSWYEQILRAQLEEDTIHNLIEMSLPVFNSSMVVLGMDFTVLAKAGEMSDLFNEPVFGSTDESYGYVNKLKNDEAYNKVREQDGAFLYFSPITNSYNLCCNIKKNGSTSHRLMMLEPREEDGMNYGFLLEILASMIEHTISHKSPQKSESNKSLHNVLTTILTDRTADYVTTSQRLDTLGWYSRNEYLCLVLKITNMDQKNMTETAICSYVENAVPHSCAFPYRSHIVVFVNTTKAQMDLNTVSERLILFIRDSNFRAGYSRVMVGHFNLRRQYLQAMISLNLGERKKPSVWSHKYNDVAFDYILEQATRSLPGYMISHEKLLRLKDVDEFQHTDYMHTLKLYLDNHLNAVKTANDLYIHRSTFLYRLDKIKNLLQTDLNDPEEVLYLMLSFRFIEMEEKEEPQKDITIKD